MNGDIEIYRLVHPSIIGYNAHTTTTIHALPPTSQSHHQQNRFTISTCLSFKTIQFVNKQTKINKIKNIKHEIITQIVLQIPQEKERGQCSEKQFAVKELRNYVLANNLKIQNTHKMRVMNKQLNVRRP